MRCRASPQLSTAEPPPPALLPLATWCMPVSTLLVLVSVILMLAPSLLSSIDPRQGGRELDCHQAVEVRAVPSGQIWAIGMLIIGQPRWLGYGYILEGDSKWRHLIPTLFWLFLGSIPVRVFGFILDGALSPVCVPQVGWFAYECVQCWLLCYHMYRRKAEAE